MTRFMIYLKREDWCHGSHKIDKSISIWLQCIFILIYFVLGRSIITDDLGKLATGIHTTWFNLLNAYVSRIVNGRGTWNKLLSSSTYFQEETQEMNEHLKMVLRGSFYSLIGLRHILIYVIWLTIDIYTLWYTVMYKSLKRSIKVYFFSFWLPWMHQKCWVLHHPPAGLFSSTLLLTTTHCSRISCVCFIFSELPL